jgi:hypothetical protein
VSGSVPPIGEMVPGAEWLIWSNSRAGFLNATKTGATRIIERAARFTSAEAKAYCDAENAKAPAHGKFNAIGVPDPSLAPLVRPWLG